MENRKVKYFVNEYKINNPYNYGISVKIDREIMETDERVPDLEGVKIPPNSGIVVTLPVPINLKIKEMNMLDSKGKVEGVMLMLVDIDY